MMFVANKVTNAKATITVNNIITNNTQNNVVNNTPTKAEQNNIANNVISNIAQDNSITNNSSNVNINIGENDLDEKDIYYPEPNYSIEINGITDDISKHIKNQDEFNKELTEYVYNNGLSNANSMEVQKYEYQERTGRLGIIFKLNNPDENRLRVIINSNGNIDISDYN